MMYSPIHIPTKITASVCDILVCRTSSIKNPGIGKICLFVSMLLEFVAKNHDAVKDDLLAIFNDLSGNMYLRLQLTAALFNNGCDTEAGMIGTGLNPGQLLQNSISEADLSKLLAVMIKLNRMGTAKPAIEHFLQTGMPNDTQIAQCVAMLAECGEVESALLALNKLPSASVLIPAVNLIFELLCRELFDEARQVAKELDITNRITNDMPAMLQGQILFLDEILLNGSDHSAQLLNLFKQTHPPWIYAALRRYPTFLSRKAELGTKSPVEAKAVGWIANTLRMENELLGSRNEQVWTLLLVWLIIDGNQQAAIKIMEQYYRNNPEYSGGYVMLASSLWLNNYEQEALSCLGKERFALVKSSDAIFRTSFCFAFAGEPGKAAEWLKCLCDKDANYFNREGVKTHWGILAMILKSMGQEYFANKVKILAENNDPMNHTRLHMFDKIKVSCFPLTLPPFKIPW